MNETENEGTQQTRIMMPQYNRKETDDRYNHSEKGLERNRRYDRSKKGLERFRRCDRKRDRRSYHREWYHNIQEEAGCHMPVRIFYPGYRLLEALKTAEVIEI